jgi:hypothetical protein
MKRIPLLVIAGLIFGSFIPAACSWVPAGRVPDDEAALQTVVAATFTSMTAAAQSSGLPVSYENISFHIPLELNASATGSTDTRWEFPSINPSTGPMAPHAVFEFTNYPVTGGYPVGEGARLTVFKTSDYAAYGVTEQDAVTALLGGQETLQPMPEALAMVRFYGQVKPLTFQNGHGLRYLTQVLDGIEPINNLKIFYYYQGITNDGAYFVSALLHVRAPFLVADGHKDSPTPPDGVPFAWDGSLDYPAYLDQVAQKLNEASAEDFTPSLTVLDQLIESMEVTSP